MCIKSFSKGLYKKQKYKIYIYFLNIKKFLKILIDLCTGMYNQFLFIAMENTPKLK